MFPIIYISNRHQFWPYLMSSRMCACCQLWFFTNLLPWRQGRLAMQEDVIKGLTSRPRVWVGWNARRFHVESVMHHMWRSMKMCFPGCVMLMLVILGKTSVKIASGRPARNSTTWRPYLSLIAQCINASQCHCSTYGTDQAAKVKALQGCTCPCHHCHCCQWVWHLIWLIWLQCLVFAAEFHEDHSRDIPRMPAAKLDGEPKMEARFKVRTGFHKYSYVLT